MSWVRTELKPVVVCLCSSQDVRSGHGGAGGRDGPAADRHEGVEVSGFCFFELALYT